MRDFVRSAMFNILSDFVVDAAFLDLFCGTGSVGLEALSRTAVVHSSTGRPMRGICAGI
jgi:16S rRNA G966 N2-methylase RsmD